jgi:short-subunit dehydrogenase
VKDLRSRYGDYAVVTGASAGIGEQFTRQLAAKGMNVVMVARRKDRLEALANEIAHQHGTVTEVIELDLLVDGAVDELVRRTSHLDVGMVIANAGNYAAGPFLSNDLGGEVDVLTLNATVPMELAHRFGRRFAQRGRGAIVLISSTVGAGPAPYLANYAAAKAYILSLGQALNYEFKKSGVDLLVVSPGPTKTEGAANAEGIDFSKLPVPMMAPAKVARAGLKKIGRRGHVIVGAPNKAMDFMGKHLMPRPLYKRMYGRLLYGALDPDNRG